MCLIECILQAVLTPTENASSRTCKQKLCQQYTGKKLLAMVPGLMLYELGLVRDLLNPTGSVAQAALLASLQERLGKLGLAPEEDDQRGTSLKATRMQADMATPSSST